MRSRIRHSSIWISGLAVCVVLSGCRSETPEHISTEQVSEGVVKEMTEALLQDTELGQKQNAEARLMEDDRESYEAFLRGEAEALYGDVNKKIWQILQQYTVWYLYCDVDGDDRQELCVRTSRSFYVIKNKPTGLTVLFEGSTFYYPIYSEDIFGILYREIEDNGVSQKKEIYRACKLYESGETEEILTFAWTDMNDDREQSEGDQYLYNGEELPMQEWLDKTAQYRNCRELENESWIRCDLDDSVGKSVVFPNYAIYPTRITEENPPSNDPYVVWPISIELQFPQIYYSREDEGFDEEKQIQINQMLLTRGASNCSNLLIERDNFITKEYKIDYIITMADEHVFSIMYSITLDSIWHYDNRCVGITIDVDDGSRAKVSDYVDIDESLIEDVKNGTVTCFSPGYNEEYIISQLEWFLENFDEEDAYDCFYLDENNIYIIVSTIGGNENYLILKMDK